MFGEGRQRTFNFITIVFLLLTVSCCVLTLIIGFVLPPPPPLPTATVAVVPTGTNTLTPLPPTFTYTPSDTPTTTNTPTLTLSVSPSMTITETAGPTNTPTITASASPTSSPTPTATYTPSMTPTGPTPTFTNTPSPFPFRLRGGIAYTVNNLNAGGCTWQGIGGQVFDLNNQGVTGLQIHISGPGLGEGGAGVSVQTGSNTLYGPSGWEQMVASATNSETYFVEIRSSQGTQLSQSVQVTFSNNCAQNLALVNFEQTRPY